MCGETVRVQGASLGHPLWHFGGPCAGPKFLTFCRDCYFPEPLSFWLPNSSEGVKVLSLSLHSVPLCPTWFLH